MFFIFPQIFLAKGSKTAGSQIEKIFFFSFLGFACLGFA